METGTNATPSTASFIIPNKAPKIPILAVILTVSIVAASLAFYLTLTQEQKQSGTPSPFITKPEIGERVLTKIVDECLWKDEAVCQNGITIEKIAQLDIINTLSSLDTSLLTYKEAISLESFDDLVNYDSVTQSEKRDERDLHVEHLRNVRVAFASDAFYLAMKSFKINWRILAGIGEIISQGLTLQTDDQGELEELDFLDQKVSSLVEQLYSGSLELASYKANYQELLERPTTQYEFKLSNGKTYRVSGEINQESLAIYDYLAAHLTEEEFDVAAFGTGRSEAQSYVGRYKLLFNDDPRDP